MIPQENKLLDLLSNNDVTFFIPPYQRNYEWTDEQCKVFLEDVIKTCEKNTDNSGKPEEHFFGSITYFQDETPFGQPNKLVLIDGQQRITTTMLFLVAIRDLIADEGLKSFIDSKYLKNNNVTGDSEYKVKLKQVETDWAAYRDIILSESLTAKEKDSAVYRNYKYFTNRLTDYAEDNDIGQLIEKGLNKFSVITIELQPNKNEWENPQEIFESMNSLGKPLSLADLVRNYLLLGLKAEKQTELYNKYWLKIENTLPHMVSDFIRDFMQGVAKAPFPKATDANHKTLYSTFKKVFEGDDSASLLKDLSEYSTTYSYISSDTNSSGNEEVDSLLADLRKINVTTAYSFLLMLLHAWEQGDFNNVEIAEILDVFRIYCYRRRLLTITQAENKVFPTLPKIIPNLIKAKDKRQAMFEILSNQENRLRLPNDIEVARFLETMNFYNFGYCKLFLSLVEEKITKSRPDLTDKKLQIEHIMPQTLNKEWAELLGDDAEAIHQEWVHNIGNLTLIRHNQELGQKKFSDKKVVYENNAGLQIARTQITNNSEWNQKTISDRAQWIIDFILKEVLPIPEKMRKTNNFKPKEGKHLSFNELQLIGQNIDFIADPSFVAHVVSDKEVEFEGKRWKLSPLTREIQSRRGQLNDSGAYSGTQYWEYDGIRLADII